MKLKKYYRLIIIVLMMCLFGCSNDIDNNNTIPLDNKEENKYEITNILDIPNSKTFTDEEGRELLVIELSLDNIHYLRKKKTIEVITIDAFGDEEVHIVEGYYCPLYDLGWTLIKSIGFYQKIDNEMLIEDRPEVLWFKDCEYHIEKIKGKFIFCKIEDYESFGLANTECRYYLCNENEEFTCPTIIYDDDFPY